MIVEDLVERITGVLRSGIAVMDELDVGAGPAGGSDHP
jgi:hypothetical protein